MSQNLQNNQVNLKSLYLDIINGYSDFLLDNHLIYIKHPCLSDDVFYDQIYKKNYDKLLKKGVPTHDSKKQQLIENEIWSEEKDLEFKKIKEDIKTLERTKDKCFIKSQKDEVQNEIDKAVKKITPLSKIVESFSVGTAEYFANKVANEYFIMSLFFKDLNLSEKLFMEEEIDDLEDEDFNKYITIYSMALKNVNLKNIQKIAISPFFFNSYKIDSNPHTFFGKLTKDLTNFQISLFTNAKTFSSIFEHYSDIPEEILDNPEEIINWVKTSQERAKYKNKKGTIVGATAEENKKAGMANKNSSLIKKAAKEKRTIKMSEITG